MPRSAVSKCLAIVMGGLVAMQVSICRSEDAVVAASVQLADALAARGGVAVERLDYHAAAIDFQSAAELLRTALGQEHECTVHIRCYAREYAKIDALSSSQRSQFDQARLLRVNASEALEQGQTIESVEKYREALKIYESLLGVESFAWTGTALKCSGPEFAAGNPQTAKSLLERAADARTAMLGRESPLTAEILAFQAMLLFELGKNSDASQLANEADAIFRKIRLGRLKIDIDSNHAIAINACAHGKMLKGDPTGAAKLLAESLQLQEKSDVNNRFDAHFQAQTVMFMSRAQEAAGNPVEAHRYAEIGLNLLNRHKIKDAVYQDLVERQSRLRPAETPEK